MGLTPLTGVKIAVNESLVESGLENWQRECT
jgi:hypothetical protein